MVTVADKKLNLKLHHAYEQLEAIDKAKGAKKIELLKEYGAKVPLNYVLALNFDSTIEMDLPTGQAPFSRDENTHSDFMGKLVNEIKKLRVCFKTSAYKKRDKERVFLQICEGVPVKEADMLCFLKDKALTEMYPTITADFVKSVFPAYVKEKQ
jgi:hypothetical protein